MPKLRSEDERRGRMTREEVVKWLESLKREVGKAENCSLWHYAESIDVAIKTLSAEDGKRKEL